jgi:hypothetical protein
VLVGGGDGPQLCLVAGSALQRAAGGAAPPPRRHRSCCCCCCCAAPSCHALPLTHESPGLPGPQSRAPLHPAPPCTPPLRLQATTRPAWPWPCRTAGACRSRSCWTRCRRSSPRSSSSACCIATAGTWAACRAARPGWMRRRCAAAALLCCQRWRRHPCSCVQGGGGRSRAAACPLAAGHANAGATRREGGVARIRAQQLPGAFPVRCSTCGPAAAARARPSPRPSPWGLLRAGAGQG